jgi:hypothetical protein
MRIFILTATYKLRVSRKSHLHDHPIRDPTAVRFQDRELQLFDGTRLMSAAKFEDLKAAEGLTEDQLEARGVRKIHPAFREGSSLNK